MSRSQWYQTLVLMILEFMVCTGQHVVRIDSCSCLEFCVVLNSDHKPHYQPKCDDQIYSYTIQENAFGIISPEVAVAQVC